MSSPTLRNELRTHFYVATKNGVAVIFGPHLDSASRFPRLGGDNDLHKKDRKTKKWQIERQSSVSFCNAVPYYYASAPHLGWRWLSLKRAFFSDNFSPTSFWWYVIGEFIKLRILRNVSVCIGRKQIKESVRRTVTSFWRAGSNLSQ